MCSKEKKPQKQETLERQELYSNPEVSLHKVTNKGQKDWTQYNHLYQLTHLNNRYLSMRHGQSTANVEEIVVTDPAIGTVDFGLTELGVTQAQSSTQEFQKKHPYLDQDTIIISSDFLRAAQTAETARAVIGAPDVMYRVEIRERGFGTYEAGPADIYEDVWKRDEVDPFQTEHEVESLIALLERTSRLVAELENNYQGKTILLVAHGDTCLILQAAFEKVNPGDFQAAGRFSNAEIRELHLSTKTCSTYRLDGR